MISKKLKIAVIDYHLGNLFSISNMCNNCGAHAIITNKENEIKTCHAVILPGVGSFSEAMNNIKKLHLDFILHDAATRNIPIFGICLGMQLLFSSSEEFGYTEGLGLIPGEVKKIRSINNSNPNLKVPHVGWNSIYLNQKSTAKTGSIVEEGDCYYFVHSFFATPRDENDLICYSKYYGLKLTAAVAKNNLFATQFHPEKSGKNGLRLFKKWIIQKTNLPL